MVIYDFDTIYIADLNAITQQGDHDSLINEVLIFFPYIQFWIDKGYQILKKYPHNYLPVLGSESYSDENILDLKAFNNRFILSLDYSMSEELGAKSLFSRQDLWPDNIIIMTLNRIGSCQGPDLAKLNEFCSHYPDKQFIAAGGIRNTNDLHAIKLYGVISIYFPNDWTLLMFTVPTSRFFICSTSSCCLSSDKNNFSLKNKVGISSIFGYSKLPLSP